MTPVATAQFVHESVNLSVDAHMLGDIRQTFRIVSSPALERSTRKGSLLAPTKIDRYEEFVSLVLLRLGPCHR
ncbi:hypothetical protein BCO18175_01444 [Burkholderia contaminans]|uniref:Uncharacterized protein n=1 Tax=Burkholderia cenocepacia TaxID=95486 RepID=A0A6J5J5E2_9BURK|nr:hypothetical protein BCO9919_02433 [Burkholderia cenocepacia]VWC63687.1 hypothetical protein BCO18175_01444 [Burkholderia contaminans]